MDLVIKYGKIVTPSGTYSGGIAIDKGKIVAIASEEFLPVADKTIDAGGKYILPGVIDEHTHIGFKTTLSATAITETKAAAQGGVTTVGIFITRPGETASTIFESLRQEFETSAITDCFFHSNVVD
ncbi:hypothetical protein ACFLYL_04840 [Chloroflexota bacterium]